MVLWLALDRSGTLRWTYHINLNDIPSALMRDAEDNLYFSTTKKVFSLTASGRKRWERECSTPGPFLRPVQLAALTRDLMFTTCGGSFAAMDTTDGHELWKLPYRAFQYNTTPAVLRSGAIVLPEDWNLAAVDRNGNSLWPLPPPKYIAPRPRPGLTVGSSCELYEMGGTRLPSYSIPRLIDVGGGAISFLHSRPRPYWPACPTRENARSHPHSMPRGARVCSDPSLGGFPSLRRAGRAKDR